MRRSFGRLDGVIRTEDGTALIGGLLEAIWSTRRAAAFDEGCLQG